MKGRTSIKDIANKAGVALSTVSFVLNGKAKEMRISDSVAKRVEKVAQEEGYTPNNVAVSLRTGRSKILGLIVEDISNLFFAALARIIEDETNKLGYRIVYCSTENDNKRANSLITMLLHNQVDGFIVTPVAGMEKRIEKLRQQKVPLVFMDRYLPGTDVSCVLVDNKDGVNQGIEYLLNKGYKKIGFVTVDLDLISIKQRQEAYEHILNARKFKEKFILSLPFNFETNFAVKQVSEFIKINQLDAVFFATNYLGILGIESITKLNLKIPEEIAMVCFDDHDIFRLFNPGITAVKQPVLQIGQRAVELLMEQLNIKGKPSIKYKQIKAELVVRGSA